MKRQSSTKGFAVLSFASLICKVLAFIYLPIQAMLVHDNGNGVISAGYKLYVLIYTITNAGLPIIISKFISERVELGDYKGARVIHKSAFSMMMTFGIISSLFTYFASGFLAAWCGMSEAKLMFMFIAPTFLFTSVSCSLRGYFQGMHNMTPTAVSQIVEQLVNSIFTALLEVLFFRYATNMSKDPITYTAAGSAAATVLAAVASAAFLTITFLKNRSRQRRYEKLHQTYTGPRLNSFSVYRQILKFSIPAVISCIATSAIDIIDTRSCIPMLQLGGYTTVEAYSLFGIYSTKYQRLLTLAVLFAAPLITAMIPSLSAAISVHNYSAFLRKVREGFRLNFIVVMPLAAALSFLAQPIITVIFASQNAGSLLVSIGIWTSLITTVQTLQSGILISLNKPLVPPVSLLIGMVAKVACNYLLIPIHSINMYGAVIGNVCAWVISISLNQYFIIKCLGRKLHTWHYLPKPAIAAGTMGFLCLGFYSALDLLLKMASLGHVAANDLAMLATVPFGGMVYFIILARIGGITKGDIEKMPMSGVILAVSKKIPFLVLQDAPRRKKSE
ncbi:hypothetical protein SDC9_58349 [bioreactor metagenome]|uniref:Uncharacterized protein n=1 Tax=bioreactor metagenome TaxID=1076179 RepID=A0A644X853_9ZZZZ